MTGRAGAIPTGRERGSTLIEFALVGLLFLILLLSFVEFGRMLLVYNSVANAARAGVRYAIVNGDAGGTRTGLGPDPNPQAVYDVVRQYATSAPLTGSRLAKTCSRE